MWILIHTGIKDKSNWWKGSQYIGSILRWCMLIFTIRSSVTPVNAWQAYTGLSLHNETFITFRPDPINTDPAGFFVCFVLFCFVLCLHFSKHSEGQISLCLKSQDGPQRRQQAISRHRGKQSSTETNIFITYAEISFSCQYWHIQNVSLGLDSTNAMLWYMGMCILRTHMTSVAIFMIICN